MKKTAPTSTSPTPPKASRRRKKAETTPAAATPARKKMPAEVFVRIWKGTSTEFISQWKNFVKLEKSPSGETGVHFSNIEVTGDIVIENEEKHLPGLTLSNCHIETCVFTSVQIKSVAIRENSITGDFWFWKNSEAGSFLIAGSKSGMFSIRDGSIIRTFWIVQKSQVADFLIEGGASINGFYVINSAAGNFKIENASTENFRIESSKIGRFDILTSTTGDLLILKNSVTRGFWIEHSTIGIYSLDNSTASVLSLRKNSHSLKVNVWHSTLQRIQIRSGSFVGHLRCQFNLHDPVHLVLEESGFGYLDLENTVFPEFTTLSLSDCKANCLSLNNFCNYGTVFFSRLKPLNKWGDFQKDANKQVALKDGVYTFEEINDPKKFPSTLRLTDSDLGKMQFINCDLRQFQRFEFSNTKMLEVFVAGSQMPGNKAFYLPNDEKNPSKLAEQKRLAFGQFKKIYEARGDVAGALRYLSYEMRAYRAMLSDRVKRHQPLSKQWFDYVGELGILWLNQFSTNYGNNWLRGVVVTLILTVACFSFYCFLLGYRPQPIGGDWEKFGDLASHSLAYLNPFRDEDSGQFFERLKEDGLKITWYARLWDYLSRIFIAYFVYQTIQAFRKLGKSSG